MKTKLCLNKLHVSDKSCKTQSKHKPFDALKWPVCDFEKQGSHLIITIKTGLFVEFVKNVYIVVRRILKFMLRILLPDIIDSNSTSGSRSQVVT